MESKISRSIQRAKKAIKLEKNKSIKRTVLKQVSAKQEEKKLRNRSSLYWRIDFCIVNYFQKLRKKSILSSWLSTPLICTWIFYYQRAILICYLFFYRTHCTRGEFSAIAVRVREVSGYFLETRLLCCCLPAD